VKKVTATAEKVTASTTTATAKESLKNGAKKVAGTVGTKVIAYSPLLFFAWEYYNSGSFIKSCITIT